MSSTNRFAPLSAHSTESLHETKRQNPDPGLRTLVPKSRVLKEAITLDSSDDIWLAFDQLDRAHESLYVEGIRA